MTLLKHLSIAYVALLFLLHPGANALAFEGMTTGPEHSEVKKVIQTDYVTQEQLNSAVEAFRRLIAINEAQFGKNSRQVGVLLCDIGEVAFKQSSVMTGVEKTDKLKRAVAALTAGADMLKPYQNENDGYIIERARAFRFAGMAFLVLGDKKSAEAALRNGLAIHWKRFNDNAYQLDFFPILFEAVEGRDAKRKVAEAEIKIARNVYHIQEGSGHVSLDGPMKRLRIAETDGNPVIAAFDAARDKASSLAAEGDEKGAYDVLASAFALAGNDSDRQLFIGHLKPSPFFMYDDPDAPRRVGWDDYQGVLKLEPYDHVAIRYFVDHGLMPFIAEGRNNLMALLGQWEGLYDSGDKEKAAYFCRLIPGSYNGYDGIDLPGFDKDKPAIPPFCANTVYWATWMRSQGSVGQGVRYLEMGVALLPPSVLQTEAGQTFLKASIGALAEFEAYYGSPDSFLSAYERLTDLEKSPPIDLAFYAAIIRDDAAAFEAALKVLGSRTFKPGEEEEGPGPLSKLPILGPRVTAAICANQPDELPAIVMASICPDEAPPIETLEAELKATGNLVQAQPDKPFFAVPDWKIVKLLGRAEYRDLKPLAKVVFAPGGNAAFQDRKLSKRETAFLKEPRDYDTYINQTSTQTRLNDQWADDFDAAMLSTALVGAGQTAMARSWATAAIERYQSASPPRTIFSLWLSEVYDEQTYLDGWRWLILDKPLLANAAFSKHIPEKLGYDRGGVGPDTKSSLDWERVIGAYHGRIIADRRLGDAAAARQDARSLVAYLRFVLGLQSFSRNETREVIVRVARPALNEALDVLTEERRNFPADLEATFEIVQMMKPSGTGATVARLGARLAAVSPDLARLAKKREELRQRWLGMPADNDDARKALARQIDDMDTQLSQQFPRYVEISGTVAVAMAEISRNLKAKEAMVAFLDTGNNYLIFAVTPDGSAVMKTAMSSGEIDVLVRELRRGLELRGGRLPAFRTEAANELYRQLIAPIETSWKMPPEHLIFVADGALESIPFAVLLTGDAKREDLNDAPWLSDKYVMTRLPSLASLPMLRAGKSAGLADQPFLGIGDPALDGDPDTERGAPKLANMIALRGGADVADIRALPRLPETADELRALQKTFKAPDDALMMGQGATEAALKAKDVSGFRTLAFATHGLLAGEISGQEEPGLVMTPPREATPDDDGYLSASDVAALNLNADVVLLSACNTAAPEEVGAEGLSGLAKAFFFAGAKNLVVSHWSVDSAATAKLTSAMFEDKAKGEAMPYAYALREAMRRVRQEDGGKYAHPLYWGAFEVVGAD